MCKIKDEDKMSNSAAQWATDILTAFNTNPFIYPSAAKPLKPVHFLYVVSLKKGKPNINHHKIVIIPL